jgi:hypothetical protein
MTLVLKKKVGQLRTGIGLRDVYATRYFDGRALAIILEHPSGDPSSVSTFSTNLDNRSSRLDPGFFYAKTWSENAILQPSMVNSGWFDCILGKDVSTGFVKAQLWKLKDLSFLPDMVPLRTDLKDEKN